MWRLGSICSCCTAHALTCSYQIADTACRAYCDATAGQQTRPAGALPGPEGGWPSFATATGAGNICAAGAAALPPVPVAAGAAGPTAGTAAGAGDSRLRQRLHQRRQVLRQQGQPAPSHMASQGCDARLLCHSRLDHRSFAKSGRIYNWI